MKLSIHSPRHGMPQNNTIIFFFGQPYYNRGFGRNCSFVNSNFINIVTMRFLCAITTASINLGAWSFPWESTFSTRFESGKKKKTCIRDKSINFCSNAHFYDGNCITLMPKWQNDWMPIRINSNDLCVCAPFLHMFVFKLIKKSHLMLYMDAYPKGIRHLSFDDYFYFLLVCVIRSLSVLNRKKTTAFFFSKRDTERCARETFFCRWFESFSVVCLYKRALIFRHWLNAHDF